MSDRTLDDGLCDRFLWTVGEWHCRALNPVAYSPMKLQGTRRDRTDKKRQLLKRSHFGIVWRSVDLSEILH